MSEEKVDSGIGVDELKQAVVGLMYNLSLLAERVSNIESYLVGSEDVSAEPDEVVEAEVVAPEPPANE